MFLSYFKKLVPRSNTSLVPQVLLLSTPLQRSSRFDFLVLRIVTGRVLLFHIFIVNQVLSTTSSNQYFLFRTLKSPKGQAESIFLSTPSTVLER